ncbi:hypothetical protein [Natrinema thermotolerans]|uniref:hypothetical protein n=1 Tax=Natrinema thermotolerans TaxID=121872 RepID=UPI00067988B4|nr:hypothetical protein [Natrinema thermotolerans]QCC57198.1 hypothetical protein DVR14_00555 [Natrinema thermotolerans]
MNWFNALVAVGIGIILLPALLGGGFILAGLLVLGWLLAVFGGRLGIDVLKERQSGATAAKYKTKTRLSSERDDGQRWDR